MEELKDGPLRWISWYQPTADFRPLADPPNEAIIGWWCTGQAGIDDGGPFTLCALVIADSDDKAKASVHVDWPEAENWRFCDPRATCDLSDRFQFPSWMRDRATAWACKSAKEHAQP